MPNLITQAQPPLEFIPPAFDPIVTGMVRSLLPVYRHWRIQIAEATVENAETLAKLYQQFEAGKNRFLIAFRHPSANDPFCMAHLLWKQVPEVAHQHRIKLHNTPHAHFIYDRGIPLWAGKPVGWLYSRLGGTSIRRGKLDLMGLRSIRQLFASGQFPMAAAPEGATNGHNEIISPLEPGISQFGFWCVEDLLKAGRSEQVFIIPVGIQYRYLSSPWQSLNYLLRNLEIESGFVTTGQNASESIERDTSELTLQDGSILTNEQETALYSRLYRLGEHLLSLMEEYYTKFYHQTWSTAVQERAVQEEISGQNFESGTSTVNEKLANRLQTLLNAALAVAEQYFDLSPKGTLTDRCRRLEQAGWDRIYREDLKQLEGLSLLERGLADRVAEEANLRLWHMRLVETFVSVTGRYVIEKPTADRFAEMLLLLWDTITRLKGEVPFPRPQLGQQRVQMTVGQPLAVSDRWQSYQTNRRQAVACLTQDLQTSLEKMIVV